MEDDFKGFSTIQASAEFKGYEGDADRFVPEDKSQEQWTINQYGVRVRKGSLKTKQDDNDEVVFSVNQG